jgi:serine protease Do
MAQEMKDSPSLSSLLPDAFSHPLMQLIHKAQASIVQVRNEGRGIGTGIIWSADGYVITNHHVVPTDTSTIQVHLSDDRLLEAKVIDRHPKQDLAMLRIVADDLQAASVGDSAKLRVGEWVFAIGNPWGQRGVVTAGIVSGISAAKEDGDDSPRRYIKSDVRLAPGNSGGPLLDAEGKVIGINAMIFGGDLAVAIPSNVVSSWVAGLPKRRVTLGIEVQPIELPSQLCQKTGLEAEQASGLLVTALGSDSLNGKEPVTDTGVLIGDILLNVAGKSVIDAATLLDIVARHEPQEIIKVQVVRGGSIVTLDVEVKTLEQQV